MSEAQPVCLVSPGHFSSNPRLVKELTALRRAAYPVRTVTSGQVPWFAELDAAMAEPRAVPGVRLKRLGKLPRILLRLRQKAYRLWVGGLFRLGLKPGPWQLAEALNPDCRRLRNALRRHNAGQARPFALAIAHNLAALPAAAEVARETGVRFAFDAEDSHVDELYEHEVFERRLRRAVESAYLPDACYVSAASPGIGRALERRYGISPTVLLNVFAPDSPPADSVLPLEAGEPLRFFWFSQTVGPDRGLDLFMNLAPGLGERLGRPLALTLAGRPVAGYEAELRSAARACGVSLELLPLLAPEALFDVAARHHCGLALERREPVNKDICLANKIFTYLAAGIPMLLTPTSAHRELAPELTGAALLLEEPPAADGVARWLDETVCSGQGRVAARQLFRSRFNWDRESGAFLACVSEAIGR